MTPHLPSETAIADWITTLGVTSLCQWDVLVFLSRHQATLLGAESLARLLGYALEPLVAALDALEALALVERSRVSQGARLYRSARGHGRCYSSSGTKSRLRAPQTGQTQLSGTASNGVPGSTPPSGSPSRGS